MYMYTSMITTLMEIIEFSHKDREPLGVTFEELPRQTSKLFLKVLYHREETLLTGVKPAFEKYR